MNWAKKQKLPAIDTIKFNRLPYNKLDNLWQALHQSYNLAQDRPINQMKFSHVIKQNGLHPLKPNLLTPSTNVAVHLL